MFGVVISYFPEREWALRHIKGKDAMKDFSIPSYPDQTESFARDGRYYKTLEERALNIKALQILTEPCDRGISGSYSWNVSSDSNVLAIHAITEGDFQLQLTLSLSEEEMGILYDDRTLHVQTTGYFPHVSYTQSGQRIHDYQPHTINWILTKDYTSFVTSVLSTFNVKIKFLLSLPEKIQQ